MATAPWIELAEELQPAMLTVEEQALPPNDRGELSDLLWTTFFPRKDVPSVKLASVTALDYRPTADRREWNARGRLIPMPTPARRNVEIVPIEARDKIDEQEMQYLTERAQGNAATLADLIGAALPDRTARLVDACYRRVEVDAANAWCKGTIVQKNPETGQTYTASFGFSGTRLNTAGTAWDNGGVNAYTLLLAWIVAAEDLVGPIDGAMLRLNTLNAILADAPNLPSSVTMTRSQLAERISEDRGSAFEFFVNESSVDVFNDGGTSYTRTKVWPAGYIAAVPAGRRIGSTAFAPVARAMELSQQLGGEGIDVRGVTVYHEASGGGRELAIEAQVNALSIPDESRLYVTNTQVA